MAAREIIDLFTTGLGHGAEFTVNTAVSSVDLVSSTGAPEIMYSGNNSARFGLGDNFILLSAGFFLPENFVMAAYEGVGTLSAPLALFSFLNIGPGTYHPIGLIGDDGYLRMPFANYEMSLGIFVNPAKNIVAAIPDPVLNPFNVCVQFPYIPGTDNPQISMINVPAAMDGLSYQVTPFIKILHNFPLA